MNAYHHRIDEALFYSEEEERLNRNKNLEKINGKQSIRLVYIHLKHFLET